MSLQPVFSVLMLYFLLWDIGYPPAPRSRDAREVSVSQQTHLMHTARARASVEIPTNPSGSAGPLGGCRRCEPDSRADVKQNNNTPLLFTSALPSVKH